MSTAARARPSLKCRSAATITNMGAELGATTSIFASRRARPAATCAARAASTTGRLVGADPGAEYDERIVIDLDELEPLIALPHSPDSVVPVREVAGTPSRPGGGRLLHQLLVSGPA